MRIPVPQRLLRQRNIMPACPASDGMYGTTAAAGASVITECYQPADIEMGDLSGTYQYITDCYYSD